LKTKKQNKWIEKDKRKKGEIKNKTKRRNKNREN
jgi:hypothetical protein